MRVAIIGGTFDPIHLGHIAMARYALSKHACDEVWFMVAKDTPLKNRTLLAMDIRVHMCEMALKPFKKMRVCTLEKDLPGISYTIHTVRKLHELYPAITFSWMVGGDQASKLSEWKDIDELVKQLEFWVFPRNSQVIDCAYPYRLFEKALLDVSSSEIRNGHKLYYLPRCIQRYLATYPIYIEDYVKARLSINRFEHSVRVTNVCIELAKIHGVDTQSAYMAGILHDVCKEWSSKQRIAWMSVLAPTRMNEHAETWHAYIAADYISKTFAIHNKEVAHAIYYHTIGSTHSPLAMILYIADKIEPGRGYDTSKQLELAKVSLEKAYRMIKSEQLLYLKKEIS